MTMPKFLKITVFMLLFVAVAVYVGFAFFGMESTNPNEVCDEVLVMIDDDPDVMLDSAAVISLLEKSGENPMGKKMGAIDMGAMEKVISKNPFVTQVKCYGNNSGMEVGKGRVCIQVEQMIPVLLVFDNNNNHFYADAVGNVIESDSLYARNLLVANGEINRNYVVAELIHLAQYIKQDNFWDNQIEQIYVEYDKDKQRVVTLVPRVGDHKIYLGPIDNFEKKLVRLRKFYERGLPVVSWSKYSILNLEYDNQVVGVIRGQEQKVVVKDEQTQQPAQEGQTEPQTTTQNDNQNTAETAQQQPSQDVVTQGAAQPADAQPANGAGGNSQKPESANTYVNANN